MSVRSSPRDERPIFALTPVRPSPSPRPATGLCFSLRELAAITCPIAFVTVGRHRDRGWLRRAWHSGFGGSAEEQQRADYQREQRLRAVIGAGDVGRTVRCLYFGVDADRDVVDGAGNDVAGHVADRREESKAGTGEVAVDGHRPVIAEPPSAASITASIGTPAKRPERDADWTIDPLMWNSPVRVSVLSANLPWKVL